MAFTPPTRAWLRRKMHRISAKKCWKWPLGGESAGNALGSIGDSHHVRLQGRAELDAPNDAKSENGADDIVGRLSGMRMRLWNMRLSAALPMPAMKPS